ncbi:hypothetical protein D3C85_1453420 [compost metagenome]
MPAVPHMYGKPYWLPGSLTSSFFISSGSRFFQLGNWLLSRGWIAPALISRDMKWLEGLTTS